jgi:hypothetical protein
VATYLQLCRRLAHDFNCGPSSETESLFRSIRSARVPPMSSAASRQRAVTL